MNSEDHRKRILSNLAWLLVFFFSLPAVKAEDKEQRLHPTLAALVGNWTEKGILIPGKGAAPLQGVVKFAAGPNPEGEGLVLKGSADYGAVKWDYTWLYVAGAPGGEQTRLSAVYQDSLGQKITYQGRIENKINRIQLIANLPDGGKAKAQLTVKEDGTLLIQNVNENPEGEAMVRYQADAVRDQ